MSAEFVLPVASELTLYGASWCPDCRVARRHLDSRGVQYTYVDLASEPAAQAMLDAAGIRAIPVVVTQAGQVLVEPSLSALDAAIADRVAA